MDALREQVMSENPPSLRTFHRFRLFHQANPHILDAMVRLARQARAAGYETYGIAALFEVLRWERTVVTRDPTSDYKLCNDYKPMYARLIAIMHTDLDGFFIQHQLFEGGRNHGRSG